MHCQDCAYNLNDPSAAVCRRCGRLATDKAVQILVTWLAIVALGAASGYILTGQAFSGNPVTWIRRALTFPGSIYASPAYLAAVVTALAGLVALVALASFHYGPLLGFLAAFPAGVLCGVPMAWVALPIVAIIAGLFRLPKVPAALWPPAAAAVGGVYLLWLAWTYGPRGTSPHFKALVIVVAGASLAAVVVTAAVALAGSLWKYRCAYIPVLAVAAAIAPPALLFAGGGPAEMQANMLLDRFAPSTWLTGYLEEGYISGWAGRDEKDIVPEKQLGHIFDVIHYVDLVRSKAIAACNDYMERFPAAPTAADVGLLKATMLNAKLDLVKLKRANTLECYFDRVADESVSVYEGLVRDFPGTPQEALAGFQLAQATFQSGKATEARALYQGAVSKIEVFTGEDFEPVERKPAQTLGDLFAERRHRKAEMLTRLHDCLLTARRTIALLEANHDYGAQALARFAVLDPHDKDFDAKAAALANDYADSLLADNLELALAERVADPLQRVALLTSLLEKHPQSDVRDRMLLTLARAHLSGNLRGDGHRKAEVALRRLLADYPQSTYRREAKALLDRVQAHSQ